MEPKCLWDTMHHRSLFLPEKTFAPIDALNHDIYTIESKYFLPSIQFDWFKNATLAPDSFEEGNMSNISPTIKVDISNKSGIAEEILLGATCSLEYVS